MRPSPPDRHGVYQIELVVNDGFQDSAPDVVIVNTGNRDPVADAGPEQTIVLANNATRLA